MTWKWKASIKWKLMVKWEWILINKFHMICNMKWVSQWRESKLNNNKILDSNFLKRQLDSLNSLKEEEIHLLNNSHQMFNKKSNQQLKWKEEWIQMKVKDKAWSEKFESKICHRMLFILFEL